MACRLPLLRLAAAFLLALLAAGCGPGVGGTGTGTDAALAQLNASPAPLCGSALAASLSCPTGGASTGDWGPGSAAVLLVDNPAAARVQAQVLGNGITLQAGCDGLGFSGVWAQVPGLGGRFVGQTAAGDTATLGALPVAGGVQLQLFDAQGRALWGPVVLLRVGVTPPAATCGG